MLEIKKKTNTQIIRDGGAFASFSDDVLQVDFAQLGAVIEALKTGERRMRRLSDRIAMQELQIRSLTLGKLVPKKRWWQCG